MIRTFSKAIAVGLILSVLSVGCAGRDEESGASGSNGGPADVHAENDTRVETGGDADAFADGGADDGGIGQDIGGGTLGDVLRQIWLAQTHVLPVGNQEELAFAEEALNRQLGREGLPMLKLVAGKDTLLKVDVASSAGVSDGLEVSVQILDPDGRRLWSASLDGPDTLPEALSWKPGEVQHELANAYTVILPGEHIVVGMHIALTYRLGDKTGSETHAIEVGAPIVLPLTMFDFDYFGTRGNRILSDAVIDEVRWKLPVREFRVQRVDTLIGRAAFYPQEQTVDGVRYRTPWIAATSFEDWAAKAQAATGVAWQARNERSVDHSQTLLGAMLNAGGQAYVVSMHGNFNDGTRGNFKGRGGSNMLSSSTSADVLNARNIFVHELSHNFDLWHWHEQANGHYPYKGEMFGIGAEGANGTHGGPVWRWRPPEFGDGPKGAFVAPYLPTSDGGLRYRRVISTSGARDDRATEFGELVGTYSDWDVRVAQEWFESVLRVWNADLGAWATWDRVAKSYTRQVGGTLGVNLPLDPDPVRVYSIIVAASSAAPGANLVYDPVGPYESGLMHRFDPRDGSDVQAAATFAGYCPDTGCDYSVRVVQGGTERVFMLRAGDAPNVTDPTADAALKHVAINLPAADGAIERIELLATPDAQINGMPAEPQILDIWTL
jgi:hypothetical protein